MPGSQTKHDIVRAFLAGFEGPEQVYKDVAGGITPAAMAAQQARDTTDCYPRYAQKMCAVSPVEEVLTVLTMACAYIYFALYFYHLIQATFKLKKLPRHDNKMVSLQIRLQVHLSFYAVHMMGNRMMMSTCRYHALKKTR